MVKWTGEAQRIPKRKKGLESTKPQVRVEREKGRPNCDRGDL